MDKSGFSWNLAIILSYLNFNYHLNNTDFSNSNYYDAFYILTLSDFGEHFGSTLIKFGRRETTHFCSLKSEFQLSHNNFLKDWTK